MPRKRKRKTLLEISRQPELWIFSNLLAEDWVTKNDLKKAVFEKQVNLPISLPSGTCIFKIESDGPQGIVISVSIAFGSEIKLFQLIEPSCFPEFRENVLEFVTQIYPDNFDFYSYLHSYYAPKMREFGFSDALGLDVSVKDLAEYGVKSRILQWFSDPIQGYEVPQYWRLNQRLAALSPKNAQERELIPTLRIKVCDSLAKHAIIEGLRCAIIALKHYASLLDELTSETRINFFSEYQTLADTLYKIGDFQNAAIFYSKCLSQSVSINEDDQDRILNALKDSIDNFKPQDFLEYALFAAEIARRHEE
ncbi:MAG: hypothetical protein JSV04_12885 [Candidatus Heimdallarchaeota archaeon]|nr:MAG: hypothetical protein JSV04_12885 [Candidatus Heimdallarchaeota archaeon]